MKILSIELYQFLRLALNNIQKIKIDFTTTIHVILGSNGSGKSALMGELSPLPPVNRKHFGEQGYKAMSLEHNDIVYSIRCEYNGDASRYIMVKGDELLYDGSKVTEYKRLVQQEFGLTQELFDLMRGKLKFHQMTPSELRQWFTKLSDVDYTYALRYYRKVAETLRDTTGALKHEQSKLGEEQKKLLDKDQEQQLREYIAKLEHALDDILKLRKNVSNGENLCLNRVSAALMETTRSARKQMSYLRDMDVSNYFFDEERLKKQKLRLLVEQATLQQQSETFVNEIVSLEQRLSTLKAVNNSEVELDASLKFFQVQYTELLKKDILGLEIEQPLDALRTHCTITDSIIEISRKLLPNPEMAISKTSYEALIRRRQAMQEELLKVTQSLHETELKVKEMEHYKNHNAVECPKCNHQWSIGYNEDTYEHLKHGVEVGQEAIYNLNYFIKEKNEEIETQEHHMAYVTKLSQLMKAWPVLKPFWDYLVEERVIWNKPSQINTLWQDLKADLSLHLQIKEVESSIEMISNQQKQVALNKSNNAEQLREHHAQLSVQLETVSKKKYAVMSELSNINSFEGWKTDLDSIRGKLSSVTLQHDEAFKQEFMKLEQTFLGNVIRAVQVELSECCQQLSRVDIQKALVKDIESNIAQLEEHRVLLAMTEKELSPTSGLIAKGLTNFINHFLSQKNAYIRASWLSPLEIVPVEPDISGSMELDYRFSLKVGEYGLEVPDLREASSGQLDIINRAFCVVSMKYQGLEYVPLYMDEYGAQMDHAHTRSATNAMIELLDNSNFTQLFIISHHENSYSGLVNADISVLCPNNVITPSGRTVNEHTGITH